MADKPAIVLVHGGFVDGSGWRPVYDLLTRDGYRVAVVQNLTLSLQGDAAAARLIIDGRVCCGRSCATGGCSPQPHRSRKRLDSVIETPAQSHCAHLDRRGGVSTDVHNASHE
ncbi:hypothetical protein AB0F96_18970 [Streptomyces sp. NPDC023998]|uniref:hypothetical protein n=1 Tax=Streptomyces sp. NPDC023998 TaxID=3154597 RepID=UPI0033F958CD